MAVWTVSAEEGTGGDAVAARLAAAAGVELYDRDALALLARELDPEITSGRKIEELERCVGSGGMTLLSLGVPFSPGAAEAARQLQLHHALPELGRAVTRRAAAHSCVLVASGAFAALRDHCSAVHVRLRAPLDWRVAAYQREHLVARRVAEKAVRHDDHVKHAWIKSLYRVDIGDLNQFSLVLDVSRFSCDRLVETLLAAGGVREDASLLLDG
jgi:cytidylate kinase